MPLNDDNDPRQVVEAVLARAQRITRRGARGADGGPSFRPCDLSVMLQPGGEEPPQAYSWEPYIPCREVTLLSGHGGAGKGYLSLVLSVCTTVGVPFLGREVRRGRVIYVSAEDPEMVVRRRLRIIASALQVDLADVLPSFELFDATGDGVMFECLGGHKLVCRPTRFGQFIASTIATSQPTLAVIDNASIVFDGDEINRRQTGAFVRWLRSSVLDHDGGVLLPAHVNAQTARNSDKAKEGQNFSGNTQWHNACRSRLYVVKPEKNGRLDLHHEKHQYGLTLEPLKLDWPIGSIPCLPSGGGIVEAIEGRNNVRAILKLLCEFHDRGEYISTADTGRSCASAKLSGQRGYPTGMEPRDVFNVLRDAERAGYIVREDYRNAERKPRQRFAPTPEGRALLA